jgi:hypothetical protein
MGDQPEFDVAGTAVSAAVIVGMIFIAIHLLPFLTTVLYAIAAPVLILWFIVLVLRSIINNLLQ